MEGEGLHRAAAASLFSPGLPRPHYCQKHVCSPGSCYCCAWALVVPVGRLFVEEEGFVEATLARLRDLFSGDTLANDEIVVDLVPVVPTIAVQRGGGDSDDGGYSSDDE